MTDTINRYSTCNMCGTIFVYKKTTAKGCIRKKVVYELQCPRCNNTHSKESLRKNKINLN